nr:hypothetical protein [uncultured Flavobacterium sp.]
MSEFIRNTDIKDLFYILLFLTLFGFVLIKIFENKFKTKLEFHLFGIKYSMFALVIAMTILSLKSSRYRSLDIWYTPENIQRLENKKYLLQIIKAQNQAIFETAEIQHSCFRLFVIFLIFGFINLSGILKMKSHNSKS